jgi:hypothetical protein
MALALVMAVGGAWAATPTVKLIPRPLTPGDLKSCPTGTRGASGLPNVGVGQPLYLEALVTKGTVVNSVTWTLLNKPSTSLAVLQASPVTNSLLTYDVGDQIAFDVADRRMLVPDVISESVDQPNDIWNDYLVSVQLNVKISVTSNANITVTNRFESANYMGRHICGLCHADKTNTFNFTAHATAFTRKIDGGLAFDGTSVGTGFKQSCYSCHTLGYDVSPLATNGGFDDIATSLSWIAPTSSVPGNWISMPVALQDKANIQCENCHGPAGRHVVTVFANTLVNLTNSIGISLSAGNCGQCHDSPTHHPINYEWAQSQHGSGNNVNRSTSPCLQCHSTKGFVGWHDPDYNPTNNLPIGTFNEGITCAACHDPHSTGMGTNQIRSFTSVVLSNGVVNTLGGDGLLCMQCHHDRNSAESNVNSNASTRAPHHGTQGDMLIGANAIEYGMVMPKSRHLLVVNGSCVGCHMQTTPTSPTNATYHVGEHTFKLRYSTTSLSNALDNAGNAGSNDVFVTTTCQGCHGAITNFNFGGEDWDRNGVVEGVQSEIQGLLNQIAVLLPPYGSTTTPSPQSSWTLSQRRAAWNYLFVMEDRSLGVHNPKYAAAILQASLDDLRGGIDVNRDGLPDAWQIQYYGSITNPAAAPGADPIGKGLTNLQNYQLGLDPTKMDTDGDGYSDLAELQAGSDPLNPRSTPVLNMVTIMPALELGYLPGTNGVPMHFQVIDTLVGGTWTNIGSGFISSTTNMFYQLVSPRGSKQQSFRVSTP